MKRTIIIFTCITVLVVIALVVFLLLNRESAHPKQSFVLVPVGDGEEYVLDRNAFMLGQGFALANEDKNPIDESLVESFKVKYAWNADFGVVPTSGDTKGVIIYLPVWPPLNPGERTIMLQIVYKNGTITKEAINWDQPREVAVQATGETDAVKGAAYRLGDLDLTSFEQAYHIRPSGSALRVESSGDRYFWLKDSAATPGEHIILLKQDSVWYIAKINI